MINPYQLYPLKYGTPDLIWLWGVPQDITVSGDGTGSPWKSPTYKDLLAPWHLMMIRANRIPNEDPDTPDSCQAYEAMSDIFKLREYHEDNNNYIGDRNIGSDGEEYQCFIDNGPDILPSNPSVDPVGDTGPTWNKINQKKQGSITIDMAAASGPTVFTGLGFKPKLIKAQITGGTGGSLFASGSSDGISSQSITLLTGSSSSAYTNLLNHIASGAIGVTIDLTSFDNDGFTLNRTKIGSPSGSAFLQFIAYS